MIKIENKQIYSDAGKYVHRLGTEQYFRMSTTLKDDVVSNFEEVDEIPEYAPPSENSVNEQMLVCARTMMKTTVDVPSIVALEMPDLFPNFVDMIGEAVKTGQILRYMGQLYRVRQDHTVQAIYTPGLETAALYEVIDREHAGTLVDPIPYIPPMEIFSGKYYKQNGVLYLCNRDSGQALTHNLEDLVGLYVEKVEE